MDLAKDLCLEGRYKVSFFSSSVNMSMLRSGEFTRLKLSGNVHVHEVSVWRLRNLPMVVPSNQDIMKV